jgi:arsenate reductase-like glutaredoxin family protein
VKLEERDFFKNPLSRTEMDDLLKGQPASVMFNFRSPSFKKLGLKPESQGDGELIDLMLNEPRLVRRPVVKIADTVYFGADRSVLEGLIDQMKQP